MTPEMLMMSKEELVNAIVEADKLSNEMDDLMYEMVRERLYLCQKAELIQSEIDRSLHIMRELAETNAELRKLLKEKYGCFVI